MKQNRLNRVENLSADDFPTTTPEQDAEDWENVLNDLFYIAEKMPPDNSKETLKDILEDFQKPRTTIVQRHDGKRISICDGVVTVLGGSEVTKNNAEKVIEIDTEKNTPETTFTKSELETIERLRNEK